MSGVGAQRSNNFNENCTTLSCKLIIVDFPCEDWAQGRAQATHPLTKTIEKAKQSGGSVGELFLNHFSTTAAWLCHNTATGDDRTMRERVVGKNLDVCVLQHKC